MKRKLNKFVYLFILPVCIILLSGFFSVAVAQTAYAVSDGYGAGIYVGKTSTFNFGSGSISGFNTTGLGGGVFVDAGGTFNMTGGTLSGNTAMKGGGVYISTNGTFTLNSGEISGNSATEGSGENVYNGGTFIMNGGTVGKSDSPALFYNFYNTTTKLYGGNFYENIYSYSGIETKVEANITGQIEFVETGILTVENYAGTTPKYTVRVTSTRGNGAIIVFKGGSETAPDLSKISISGYDTNKYVVSCEKDSNNVWTVGLSRRVTNVTFNPNGGSCNTASKNVYYGDTYGDLPSASKSGYTFAGWSRNYFDVENGILRMYQCQRNGTTFTFDTGTQNTNEEGMHFEVQGCVGSQEYVKGLYAYWSSQTAISFTFTKDSSYSALKVKLNGNASDGEMYIDISRLTDGETYVFQAYIEEMSMNHMVVKDIMIEENSENVATTYTNDIISSSTVNNNLYNHTLFARWTERKVTVRGNNGEGESSYLGDLNEVISLPSLSTPTDKKFRGFQGNSAYIGFNDQSQNTWYTIDSKYKFEDLITVNCWVYMDNWSTFTRAISCTEGGGWNFEKDTVNNEVVVRFAIYDKGVDYKSTNGVVLSSISSGWHMLTGVFDGTKAYFYFDADLKATSSVFSSGKIGYNANNSIIVGAEAGWQENQIDTGIPVLPGKVRNVTIINSAFSSSDIAKVYNAGYMASTLFYGFSNRTEDILEAQWETAVYDVKFDPTNGESVTTGSAKFGQSYGSYFPSNPTKNGYNFVGWSKNFFNHNMAIIDDCCSQNGTTFTFDTGSANTDSGSMSFAVQGCIGTSTYVKGLCSTQSVGLVSFVITKDSSYTFFKIKLNGNNKDAYFYIDATHLANGQYVLQANILEMSMNRIVVKDIMIEQNEKSLTTDSTSSALSTSSVCSESCGHTLFAWWSAKKIKITLDASKSGKTLASTGTTHIYYYYGTNIYYSDEACTNQIKTVTLPTLTGYTLNWFVSDGSNGGGVNEGYVRGINSEGVTPGTISDDLNYDIYADSTLKAYWTANKIKITLNPAYNSLTVSSAGTTAFWYYFDTNVYYSNEACTTVLSSVTLPTISKYSFLYYYGNGTCGGTSGERYVYGYQNDGNTPGAIASDLCTDIYKDATLYAIYELNEKDFPSNWANQIGSSTYMTTTISFSNLTSIKFVKSVPSGYTRIGTLSTGIPVYKGSTTTIIAFVLDGTIYAPANCTSLFANFASLSTLQFDNFDTSKVTNMYKMFYNSAVTSLDLKNFNTKLVTDMSYMFAQCVNLTSLNVTSFDTLKVTNMDSIFFMCSDLTSLNVTNFETMNVTNMNSMFNACNSLTSLDLSGFNTGSATNMGGMFYQCTSLESVTLTSFRTTSVTNMDNMFGQCRSLIVLDLKKFNMSKVTSASKMLVFGTSSKLHKLVTPYNNTITLEVTGSTTFYDSNGNAVYGVPANTSSSLTYYTAESAHSFKTSTYYSQIAKNRAKHNVSTTKTCTVCYYSKTTETTEAHSFLSTGSCSKCGFSIGTQYILKNNYDDDRDIDIFFEKDKQRKEFFVLKVAG